MSGNQKLWGGRFAADTDAQMERFNASINFDCKLLAADVLGSRVQARALERAGVLSGEELAQIEAGLDQVLVELSAPDYPFNPKLEDIHMAVESRLTELIGPLGGKLHTGRSRNDQVNLDERLYLREHLAGVQGQIRRLQAVLIESAEAHSQAVLPGYTHLQQAQPILFSHYAMSLFWMLDRDWGRLADTWKRADRLPLGSGALAGSAFAVDREFMRRELGFGGITANSLDAVSDRDFFIEALAALAIIMMHLSRYCEDLIIWSSAEFGFVELADAYATGSSMMPQKKNPDSLELIRGKTGRVYGSLTALLTVMKGIPLTYAKDMQEDKEPVFDSFESVQMCLDIFTGAWATMTVKVDRMEAAIDDAALATDLADYLVRGSMPFRDAHRIVGALVLYAQAEGKGLSQLDLEELQRHSSAFGPNATELLDVRRSLEWRNIDGGTGPEAVRRQIEQGRALLTGQ